MGVGAISGAKTICNNEKKPVYQIINEVKDFPGNFVEKMGIEIQGRLNKVTMQAEPVDPMILTKEIKSAIQNAIRPEVGQAHHIIQPQNTNFKIDYTIGDLQQYANKRGRELERSSYKEQQVQPEEYHRTNQEEQNSNYVVRQADRVQVEESERE